MVVNVDLKRVVESADKAFNKIAEQRLIEYIRGLKVQAHNLTMKHMRLTTEAEQAEKSRQAILERIGMIEKGEWSAIEPFELQDKPVAGEKQETAKA